MNEMCDVVAAGGQKVEEPSLKVTQIISASLLFNPLNTRHTTNTTIVLNNTRVQGHTGSRLIRNATCDICVI